ncbi:MAG: molybdopterin-dependent oxidoreductase [Acidimicrobiales bacterium]|nr:molybdopterin-dependent oxidoreductase [Acidimicrobiales bacterium]
MPHDDHDAAPAGHRRLRCAASGLLAAAVGLGAAELTTGLVRSWRSPVEVVAEVVIDKAPSSVTRFGIEVFGKNDKLALIIGILAALTVISLVVGLLSCRRPFAGVVAFAGFALVGATAALQVAGAPLVAVVPSLVAGAVGLVTLRFLQGRAVLPGRAATTSTVPAAAGGAATAAAQADPDPADPGAAPSSAPVAGEKPVHPDGPEPDPSLGVGGARIAAGAGVGLDRRRFLLVSAGLVAFAGFAAAGGRALRERFSAVQSRRELVLPAAAEPLAPLAARHGVDVEGMTPFRTSNADFYRIDTALTVPQVPVEGWTLAVKGMVDDELTLTFDELCALGLVEADVTMTCVSNRVGGDLVGNARWLGVPVQRLLDEVGGDPAADQLVGRSVDGYTCGFPVSAVGDGRTCLVAVGMNGEPLPLEHGFPARLITAGLYGYVSATKWLSEIELTTFDDFEAYWVPRGYAQEAPIKTQCRIDVPRTGTAVPTGEQYIAGVAWAQTRGIAKVEVRVDDGPWREAELAPELTAETWRQWRLRWNPRPGSARITCRATDADGALMPEERSEPLPDGATGWQSKLVIVQAA